ncbi:MAG: bifunctional UDP-N-acetylglucosamine diphosphorylase/glucosamine-1-phosphate N-acetyltransferase GlmU [Actinomycetes bacterium]|jgi:bifunctional UDP-N-acetylglucosamine pyrophosphorylase/glucosamine-1-phosphate N-acetyltransferase
MEERAEMAVKRPLAAIVLAAGEGTRMRSETPKVLHPLAGRPMLAHLVDALTALSIDEMHIDRVVVVVGHGAERVTTTLQGAISTSTPVDFVEQPVQRGTGDATAVALSAFSQDAGIDEDDVVVLVADVPLLRTETIKELVLLHRKSDAAATLLTMHLEDPTGYGRIVRDARGLVARIVEQSDADESELAITEVNPAIYCFKRSLLAPALRRLTATNAQGEYYLTDVIGVLREAGHSVSALTADDHLECMGVNDRVQLSAAERVLRERINTRWMRDGVTMVDPSATYIDASVTLEADVRLLPGTILEGDTRVGTGAIIGPNSRLINTQVGERSVVQSTNARDSEIGPDCTVGPYASLRPGTKLAAGVHVGTYVELKNVEVDEGAKIPHLAYIGDAKIGARSNIGAGTITANYDGKMKHQSVIGADVRIGSNTVLRAPVSIGDGAYTAAGSVVTRDVPPGALAKGVPAEIDEGWADRLEEGS